MRKLLFMSLTLAIFIGCAKANDPVSVATAEHRLKVDLVYPAMGEPLDFAVDDNNVYVAEDEAGFSIFNKNTAELLTRKTNEGSTIFCQTRLISVFDSLLVTYEGTGSDHFLIWSINNPQHPLLLTTITGQTAGVKRIVSFGVTRQYNEFFGPANYPSCFVYLRNDNLGGLYAMGIAPNNTTTGGAEITSIYRNMNNAIIENNDIYIAISQKGIAHFYSDFNNPISNWLEADTPGEAQDLVKVDDYIYVACRQSGLQVVKVEADRLTCLEDKGYDTSGYATSLSAEGNLLVVGSGGGGVYLFDITQRDTPVFIDRLTTSDISYVNKVKMRDGYVYVAARDDGVVRLKVD